MKLAIHSAKHFCGRNFKEWVFYQAELRIKSWLLSFEYLIVFSFFSAQHMKKQNKFLNHRKLENKIYALSRYTCIWKTPMAREGLLRSSLSCMNSMNKKEIILTLVNHDIKDNIWTADNLIKQKYAERVDTYRICKV